MTETVTLELTEVELGTLRDCVRWTKKGAEDNGHRRVKNRATMLQNTINEQVGDDG